MVRSGEQRGDGAAGASSRRQRRRGRVRAAVGVAAGFALLVLLAARVPSTELRAALAGAERLPLAAAGGCLAGLLALEAVRLRMVFAGDGLSLPAAIVLTLVGCFLGSLTPGAIGSEAYKLYRLRLAAGLERALALLGLLRVSGFAGLLVACVAVAFFTAPSTPLAALGWRPIAPAAWKTPGLSLLAVAAVAVAGLAILARGQGHWRDRGAAAVARAAATVRAVPARQLAGLAVTAVLGGVARIAALAAVVVSVTGAAPPPQVAATAAVALVAGSLPLTPGGVGVQEATIAVGLTAGGTPQAAAVAAALLYRGLLWCFAVVGAVIAPADALARSRAAAAVAAP